MGPAIPVDFIACFDTEAEPASEHLHAAAGINRHVLFWPAGVRSGGTRVRIAGGEVDETGFCSCKYAKRPIAAVLKLRPEQGGKRLHSGDRGEARQPIVKNIGVITFKVVTHLRLDSQLGADVEGRAPAHACKASRARGVGNPRPSAKLELR